MKNDCFAYRAKKNNDDGIMWLSDEHCDCLEEMICKTKPCPFYKPKDSVRMYVVHKMIQYEDLR